MSEALDIGVFGARGIPSTYSGYETFLSVLLPELAARGHRVTMYCRRGDVPAGGPYSGVRRVHLPALPSKQLSTPSHGVVAAAAGRMAKHDLVFVVNVSNAGICLLLRLTGQRVVMNTDGQEWMRGKWGRVGRKVFLASAHLTRWSVNAVVSDCEAMRDIYRRQFATDSTVIPYCWPEVIPTPDPALLRRLGIGPRRYFLVGGRLVPENQIAPMTRAYLSLDLAHPILVLGEANYRSPVADELSHLARSDNRVILAGHVDDRSEYCGLLRDAIAYIHGHQVGGMNPSLVEAMGSAARIIAFATPFNRETIGDSGDFFESAERDLGPLLLAVAAEPEAVNAARRRDAQARAHSRFGLEEVAAAHEQLFSAVSGRPVWSTTRLPTRWEQRAQARHAKEV